ncbi:MAG: Hsp20 family protein [Alphaproteobacteria bacterium]
MPSFDLTPLFRNSVGFDRMARMLDNLATESQISYPPYNIEKLSDSDYAITMAVAGFSPNDLDITVHQNQLTIQGRIRPDPQPSQESETADAGDLSAQKQLNQRVFLHRGIAERSFERSFSLADHISITGAQIDNGLLHVLLHHEVPESAKPRRIHIETPSSAARSAMIDSNMLDAPPSKPAKGKVKIAEKV